MRLERFELDADPAVTAARVRALVPEPRSVEAPVRQIVARVRDEGDAALLELTRSLDTGGVDPRPLRVTAAELAAALDAADPELRAAIKLAADNVRAVALAGLGEDSELDLEQGQHVALREVPVRSAGVYVPGGRAPYPSTVVMGAVTARVAGVERIVVCTPPGSDGDAHTLVLAACALCDVDEVYRMGGAQAIAALAYGTVSVVPVDVIVGPGNLFVQEAKRQVLGQVGIDGFAGPSELLALLGGQVQTRLVALDLLAQAEHGADSLVAAVSPDEGLLAELERDLAALTAERPIDANAACALVTAPDLDAALSFADALAPEHLELVGADAEALSGRVRAAGCVFVGAASATAFGDYVCGTNHVLPTGGAARFGSALSPQHFRRRMAEVRIDAAAGALAPAGAALARAEGFTVHAESIEARVRDNGALK